MIKPLTSAIARGFTRWLPQRDSFSNLFSETRCSSPAAGATRLARRRLPARLVDPEFVKVTGGGEVTWTVATKITCPNKTVAKREFWNRVRVELFTAERDLLLCSAGSLSAVLCEHARQAGRKALDIGAFGQTLLGRSTKTGARCELSAGI